ncbi:MAG: 4'-phosphopantetheinyl transferase superfamily protein [Verrucomicrobiota bacterium]
MPPAWIQELPLPQAFHSRNVQLYQLHFEAGAMPPSTIWSLLNDPERERAERFRLDQPRRNFVGTRAALRLLVAERLGIQPSEVRLAYSDKGKPSLAADLALPSLHFNVSHSGDVALIALSVGQLAGADVEQVRPGRDFADIVRLYCAPGEHAALQRADPSEQLAIFYRLWTRKEAVLKGAGQGITSGLKEPDVSTGGHAAAADAPFTVKLGETIWLLHDLTPQEGYTGALAIEMG